LTMEPLVLPARANLAYSALTRQEGGTHARRWVLATVASLVVAAVLALASSGAAGGLGNGSREEAAIRHGDALQAAETKPPGRSDKETEPGKETASKQDKEPKKEPEKQSTKKPTKEPTKEPGAASGSCASKFVKPPEPKTATEHNGIALADVCFMGKGPHHVFIIGDWGGLKKDGKVQAASHLNHRWNKTENFKYIWPTDQDCQWSVARVMADRAPVSKPEYILNMGDNFYWGGVEDYCGADIMTPYSGGGSSEHAKDKANQWKEIFEDIYHGEGIDGLQWLGVLGNHDWGGWQFNMAWDQAIGYTWTKVKTSKDRWMTPALYYRVKVKYPDFSVDYWFMDTNVFDALPYGERPTHNICGPHNPANASCTKSGGPPSVKGCRKWFLDLWEEQKKWLAKTVQQSTAEWRIVVTHFPPYWGKDDWVEMAQKHELDAVITGHRHAQNMHCKHDAVAKIWGEDPNSDEMNDFLDPTAWIVSGGGGGITSEHVPDTKGYDDQYGFMDMTLTKDKLKFEALSHKGVTRKIMVIGHSYAHGGVNEVEKEENATNSSNASNATTDKEAVIST